MVSGKETKPIGRSGQLDWLSLEGRLAGWAAKMAAWHDLCSLCPTCDCIIIIIIIIVAFCSIGTSAAALCLLALVAAQIEAGKRTEVK